MDDLVKIFSQSITYIGIACMGGVSILWGTNKLLKQQNEEYKTANMALTQDFTAYKIATETKMASLQSQIDSIQNVPLAKISETMASMSKLLIDGGEVIKDSNSMLREIRGTGFQPVSENARRIAIRTNKAGV